MSIKIPETVWDIATEELGKEYNMINTKFAGNKYPYMQSYEKDMLDAIDNVFREICEDQLYMNADERLIQYTFKTMHLFRSYVGILMLRSIDFEMNYDLPDKFHFRDEALNIINSFSVLQDAITNALRFDHNDTGIVARPYDVLVDEIASRYEHLLEQILNLSLKVVDD